LAQEHGSGKIMRRVLKLRRLVRMSAISARWNRSTGPASACRSFCPALPCPQERVPGRGPGPALEHALLKMLEPEPDKRPLHARAALALLDREPPTTGPTIHIQPMGYQATPTIPVNRSRRTAHPYKLPIPPYQPQRTHHRTDEHELFDSMNELAETFQDSPQAVGRIDPTLRPPQLWQIEYSKLKFGSKRKAGLLGQLMSMFTLLSAQYFWQACLCCRLLSHLSTKM
ncbi:MAG: hypothetical protein HC876_14170, partial [Chloroflexaceae bacterium]|nr:hypothetical protein [Chloroflexaceae bacterium]